MRAFFIFSTLFLFNSYLFGQDSLILKVKPLRTIEKGKLVGVTLVKTRDEGHSPLLYRGLEIYLHTYRERMRANVNTRIEAEFSGGNPKTRIRQTIYRSNIITVRGDLNYHVLFRLSDNTSKSRWQLGPMLGNIVDTRLYYFLPNNSFSYEFANYIGLSAAWTKQVQLRRHTTNLSWRGHTSLLAHVIRPNFIGMEPASTYEGPEVRIAPIFFEENKLVLANKLFLLRSEFSADIVRQNKKNIRLFYAWMFTVDSASDNLLVSARHYVGFGHTFNKDRKRVQLRKLFKRKAKPASLSMSKNNEPFNGGGM